MKKRVVQTLFCLYFVLIVVIAYFAGMHDAKKTYKPENLQVTVASDCVLVQFPDGNVYEYEKE